MATPPTGNPVGRPKRYTPEFSDIIYKAMAEEGLSIMSAAAVCGVHRDTLYAWAKDHPDIAEAMSLGQQARHLFHERKLIRSDTAPMMNSARYSLMHCDDAWRDKQSVDVNGTLNITVNAVSAAELAGGNG